ncbi:MAG: hypothetical protein F6J87_23830 [Spirulina sp. SIO3F2]|nr:hypothetical protein [Spirulina sp. SIO3F2]
MTQLPLRWLAVLVLGLGVTLASCGATEETTGDSETDSTETEALEADAEATAGLEPAPEGTFAADVQDVLATSFSEQMDLTVDRVACPESAELEATEPFECEVQTAEDLLVRVEVTPDAAVGKIDWRTKGILDLVALEEMIQTQFSEEEGLTGTADCGSTEMPYRHEEVNATFDCSFESETGDIKTVTVTVQEDDIPSF